MIPVVFLYETSWDLVINMPASVSGCSRQPVCYRAVETYRNKWAMPNSFAYGRLKASRLLHFFIILFETISVTMLRRSPREIHEASLVNYFD